MDTVMPYSSVLSTNSAIRFDPIALIEQLPTERLVAMLQLLEFLSEPSMKTVPGLQEATLLQTIQRRFSTEDQSRLEELRDRSFVSKCISKTRSTIFGQPLSDFFLVGTVGAAVTLTAIIMSISLPLPLSVLLEKHG